MGNFKLLSKTEEEKLTKEELREYYIDLKAYLSKRKLTNTTPGATTIAPKLKNITNKIAKLLINILENNNVEYVSDGQDNIPDGPVIYAHTHQGLLDGFVWIPATPKHSIVLHSKVCKKFLINAQLNTGLVLVEKDDKISRQGAKLDMITLLLKGHSISYFPESAWNLSPNKLHLPLNYGFLDIAKKSNVPVIPVVDEYTYDNSRDKEKITKIHIRFGKPIYISSDDSLEEKLEEYKEQISTMRWDLISEKGLYSRSSVSNQEYINFIKSNIKNLEMGGIDINVERENLWKHDDEFYKFYHINDVPFNEEGKLLDTDEVQKIKKINREHKI